ncbi:hypothetical protein ACWGSK_04645 [Nocardiopsis sp. NPDC055551]
MTSARDLRAACRAPDRGPSRGYLSGAAEASAPSAGAGHTRRVLTTSAA